MCSRVFTVVLALVMFWSGFATQEQAWAQALDLVETAVHDTRAALQDGSVEDHHLDDQPAHAQVEPLADMPAVFVAAPRLGTPGGPAARFARAREGWTSAEPRLHLRPPRAAFA